MTADEIDTMEAGHEIDALVGEKIFGISKWCPEDDDDPLCLCSRTPRGTIHVRESLPKFSTDDALALRALKKIIGALGATILILPDMVGVKWSSAKFGQYREVYSEAPTVSLAICRVLLKVAKMDQKGKT